MYKNLILELFYASCGNARFVLFLFLDPGIGEVCGVHLDHREICKPRSRNCILYTELVKMIKKITN